MLKMFFMTFSIRIKKKKIHKKKWEVARYIGR